MKDDTNARHQVDIQTLMQALPISGLEPQCLASVRGFMDVPEDLRWRETIELLEPPAGRRVPYVEPVDSLAKILRHQGVPPDVAKTLAIQAVDRMSADVAEDHWVNFFDSYEPESPDCLPLPDFVAWLRHVGHPDGIQGLLVAPDILEFFERVSSVVVDAPILRGPDNWVTPWSLRDLPALPTPKSMIEFVPGPPWGDLSIDWETEDNPFLHWREAIRPIAQRLETELGKSVYYFKDLGEELDDDDVHRFLVLHWCCTHRPESSFVRFLLKVSGAHDVEEFKSALIDPASYTHPFEMNSAFFGIDTIVGHINYLPPDSKKTFGIVFLTEQAREVAQSLIERQIGAPAFIVAPKELVTDAWLKNATRYCRGSTVCYVRDGKVKRPIEMLASVDEIFVLANEPPPDRKYGFDLMLSEQCEDLLWLALSNGFKVHYCSTDYMSLYNPDSCLQRRGVPERVAAQRAQRAAFTKSLKEIRLDNEVGSSGLWDGDGKMIRYDLLDLPFPLIRGVAELQREYDATMNPPGNCDEVWLRRHERNVLDLAQAMQTSLGENTAVKIYRKQRWMSVGEITFDD